MLKWKEERVEFFSERELEKDIMEWIGEEKKMDWQRIIMEQKERQRKEIWNLRRRKCRNIRKRDEARVSGKEWLNLDKGIR